MTHATSAIVSRALLIIGTFAFGSACAGKVEQSGTGANPPSRTVADRVPAQHRPTAIACTPNRPPGQVSGTNAKDAGAEVLCSTDSDCQSGVNGRCAVVSFFGNTECTYDECFTDGDCNAAHAVCECAGSGASDNHVCLRTGNCSLDSDCGPAAYCSPSLGDCGHLTGTRGYYCHTPDDECVDDADCARDGSTGGYCALSTNARHWKCSTSECVE